MNWRLRYVLRRLMLVLAVSSFGIAMVVCGVSPLRSAPSSSRAAQCPESAWTVGDEEPAPAPAVKAPVAEIATAAPEGLASLRGRVIEDPSGHALDAFYESLAVVDAATDPGVLARVSCYGDSHTAADFLTGRLRRRMQQRFGDGGHGFIAAGKPWPSYRHRDIRNGARGRWETHRVRHAGRREDEDGRYGLAGVAIETERPRSIAWLMTAADGTFGRRASSFELFYLAQPQGGEVALHLDGDEVARLSTAADDFLPSYLRVEAEDGPHELRIESRGRGPVRLFGVVVEREGPGVTVDSLGINGARITAMLSWDREVFADNLAHRGPDLVALLYGANSVADEWYSLEQYQQWLIDAVARVRRAAPEASCLLVGPPDMGRPSLAYHGPMGTPPKQPQLIEVQRDVAGLVGCGYFDFYSAMGGEDSNLRWAEQDPSMVSGDGIHFNALGYEALGDMLYGALNDGYERYLETHPR